MNIWIKKLSNREVKEFDAFYTAWKCIDDSFTHKICMEMNPDNCVKIQNSYDLAKSLMWETYVRGN